MVKNSFVSDHLTFVDLSLSRIRSFLANIGNPQNKIKNIIHVAGTNGKGSTCAFLRSILEGHGYSVNVFTSPHLVNYNERFRLSGNLITNEYLEEIKSRLEQIDGFKDLTIFELTMVIGFFAFYDKPADFNIIEVGLGGRLDASNVIKDPLLSIITTIDFDHQNFLGNTLDKIAYEKAGIIKHNSKVITDYQIPEVLKVIKKQSLKMDSKLISGENNYSVSIKEDLAILNYENKEIILRKIGLQGKHQYYNASLAIVACINILKDKFDYDNLENMLKKAEWQGRLQKVFHLYGVDFKQTDVYLDGAHNVSGCRVLCDFIKTKYERSINIHLFIGMLAKKDLNGFFEVLAGLNYDFKVTIYPLEIEDHNSFSKGEIISCAKSHNLNARLYNSFSDEFSKIENNNNENVIIICGSLYLLGKILGDNK